jgi:hypothetical protein
LPVGQIGVLPLSSSMDPLQLLSRQSHTSGRTLVPPAQITLPWSQVQTPALHWLEFAWHDCPMT